jgi:phage gpG-like protein
MKNAAVTSVKIESNVSKVIASLRKETLQRAAMAGGTVIQNYAKINANSVFRKSHGGAGLAGSIIVEVAESTQDGCVVNVGPTTIYGRIQELGGVIKPVFAQLLSWINEAGERVFAKSVTIPPRPYLRPAADEHKDEIKAAVAEQIRIGIERSL